MFKQLYSKCSHLYSTQRAPLYFSPANLVIVLYHISFFVPRYTTLVPRSKNIRVPCLCFCHGVICVTRINLLLVAHDQNHYSLSPFLCYNGKNHGQRIPCLWPPGWSCRSNVLFNGVEVMGALWDKFQAIRRRPLRHSRDTSHVFLESTLDLTYVTPDCRLCSLTFCVWSSGHCDVMGQHPNKQSHWTDVSW